MVINLTFECNENKRLCCNYLDSIILMDKNNKSITNLTFADFRSTISDSIDPKVCGGESVTGDYYISEEYFEDIETAKQGIVVNYFDDSDKSESPLGKSYIIDLMG